MNEKQALKKLAKKYATPIYILSGYGQGAFLSVADRYDTGTWPVNLEQPESFLDASAAIAALNEERR